MENETANTVRITIDLPDEIAAFLLRDAKVNSRIRKNHIEHIVKQYAEQEAEKEESVNGNS